MIVESLLVRNFRLIQEASLTFHPGIQLVLGQNAQGKTSLIESIVFLSTSTSHRTRREEDLIRWDEEAAFLRGKIAGEYGHKTLECGFDKRTKRIKIDGVPLPRIGDLYGHLRTVLFAPEDLTIVGGSPHDRRRFLDMAIAQIDPGYIQLLQDFRHALRQRNGILKRMQRQRTPSAAKELEVWDQPFITHAAQVIYRRMDFIHRLSPFLKPLYDELADDGPLTLAYSVQGEHDQEALQTMIRERISHNRQNDIERGSSQWGPHRDDIQCFLGGHILARFGSQGQRRTAALALRLAQAHLCFQWLNDWPLLLIDDVVHEMDNSRRERFWKQIDQAGQKIVTATDRNYLGVGVEPTHIVKVEHGSISTL